MSKSLWFDNTNMAKVDHLKDLETFIDENQENIPHAIYKQLVELFDEANTRAGNAQEGYEREIEELNERIAELEKESNE